MCQLNTSTMAKSVSKGINWILLFGFLLLSRVGSEILPAPDESISLFEEGDLNSNCSSTGEFYMLCW